MTLLPLSDWVALGQPLALSEPYLREQFKEEALQGPSALETPSSLLSERSVPLGAERLISPVVIWKELQWAGAGREQSPEFLVGCVGGSGSSLFFLLNFPFSFF